jgi:hypothetical protein
MAVLAKEIAIAAIVCEDRREDRQREMAGNNPGIDGHDIHVKARCLKKSRRKFVA